MPYLETGQNFSDGGSMILANYLKEKNQLCSVVI